MAFSKRKILDYSLNTLLVGIIVVLIVPSWRVTFQGWFQSWFMQEVNFEKQVSEKIPQDALQWPLFDMSDNMHSFQEFSGKPIVMSFWATWCPPCRAELPELLELQSELKKEAHIIAVSEEPIETITATGLQNSYPFLYSTTGFPSFFQAEVYPTLVVIDPAMNLVFRNEGAGEIYTEENVSFIRNLRATN